MSEQASSNEGERLFDDFEAASVQDWRREAERSLKGTLPDKLARRQPEGFALDPIYFSGDPPPAAVRGDGRPGWTVVTEVVDPDPARWPAQVREELRGGADGVVLDLEAASDTDGMTRDALRAVLEGVDLQRVELVLRAGARAPAAAALLASALGDGVAGLRGALGFDPLGTLAARGELPDALEAHLDEAAALVRMCETRAPGTSALLCDAGPYHEAGATAVQELALVLATGAFYLRALAARGVSPDSAARRIELAFPVGSRLLMEVAKLRAARLLWAAICGAFGCSEQARGARIHARTSGWSQTVRDPWVNLLRATVQTFAAVTGGARRVTVRPFDAAIGAADGFSRRLARNTQIILRDESFLDRVADPAGGSWALEAVTDRVGREAWALVQEIERRGGLADALQEGFVRGEVERVADERRRAVALRQEPVVGVSVYPDVAERPLERPPHPRRGGIAESPDARPTRIEPVRAWRAAQDFEALREAADAFRQATGALPVARLASWGEAGKLRARIDWASGALRAGGFDVQDGAVSPTAAAAAEACGETGGHVVLVCAADDDYPAGVPELRRGLAEGTSLVVAGPPPEGDPGWAAGVLFLHRKANLVAALEELHRHVGVSR